MFQLIKKNSYLHIFVAAAMLFVFSIISQSAFAASAISFERMPSIVAKVNGAIVTKYDFEQYTLLLQKMEGRKFGTLEAQRKLLQDIVDVTLIEEFCKDQKLNVDYASALRAFAQLASQNEMSPEEFEQTLGSAGIDKDALLERLHHQIIVSNFRSTFLLPKIEVSKAEVRSNRSRIIKELSQKDRFIDRVNLYEIVVYKELMDDTDFDNLKRDLIGTITADNFSDMARMYSHNPSADDGGKVGWLNFKELSPVYQSMVQSALDAGRSVEVYNSDTAILGIKLEDTKFSSKFDSRNVSDDKIEEILRFEKSESEMEDTLSKMRKHSFIEIFI